ncbi:hypothetical protein [Anaplasma capra]|uniref:hypothetical protein n=1 Tax=Anaplasma capra TaxID=1562740 RepID=UPI0021D5CDBC|nr:hypothetical protein [Anaplasma capra]MCU7611831.1 hypothetical protein [Anaplasma capra]MCU7612575.1 hypothetical protein [Anaplasma capra]
MALRPDGYDDCLTGGGSARGLNFRMPKFGKRGKKCASPDIGFDGQCVGGYPSLGAPVDIFSGGDCSHGRKSAVPSIYRKPRKGAKGKFASAGFRFFCWYVRATMLLVFLVTAPIVLLRVLSRPISGAEYSWSRTVPWSQMKKGGRVRHGLLHRLLSPTTRQMYVYMHVFLLNLAVFTLLTYAISGPATGQHLSFEMSLAWALVPTAILLVMGVCAHYASWYMQIKEPLPARRAFSLIWRSVAGAHDRVDDSVFNLMFRKQIRDSMSMSSLARSDKQLLLGVPTALVALGCYIYDRCSGEEALALNFREAAASSRISGLSVDTRTQLGLFRD